MRVHITITDDNGVNYEGSADLMKTKSKVKRQQKTLSLTTEKAGPAGAIKKLYAGHFFKTFKTLDQVMKKLNDSGINFSVQLISMAIFRAKYLTKKGSRGNYSYVQKYPPS